MAFCRYCNGAFDWGQNPEAKWVKLVPIGADAEMDRTHQDENGVLRAQHKCAGWTPAVKVVQLAKAVPAELVLPQVTVEPPPFEESFDHVMAKAVERKRKAKRRG